MDITPTRLARYVDHTLLSPAATPTDIAALIREAQQLGCYSVCISPSLLPVDGDLGPLALATVCGFPSGKHLSVIKAAEAAESVARGATEVDMVIDLGWVKAGRWELVETEIAAVRAAVPRPRILKVIIESAALTDQEIVLACQASETAGADFVKTSTGFHPAGGASVAAVRLMSETVGSRLGVKASGGIRDWDTAVSMIAAGATRLGLSATKTVLAGGS